MKRLWRRIPTAYFKKQRHGKIQAREMAQAQLRLFP